jgi:phage-related protein
MANDTSLTFSLYGKDVSATKSLQDVGNAAQTAGGHFSKIKDIAAGIGLEQGVQALGEKVLQFGKDSINAYQDVGKEVKLLQRYTGDTAEEMSKLRFAAEESGVSAETLALALGKMSKAAATTAGEKKFEAIGVSVKDMNGNMKSSSEIFTEVATKLGGMQNGVEKTNAVMQIFGRSGMELAPLLNQGAEGIAKFKDEAQKFGLVLGQDNLDAIQKNIMAHRELHAAVEGMQVQLGQFLYPAITAITKAFSEVVPVIAQMLKPAFEALGAILNPIVTLIGDGTKAVIGLMDNFKIGKGTTDNLSGAFSIFKPTIQAVENAFNTLHVFANAFLLPIFKDIAEFMKSQLIENFKTVANVVMNDVMPAIQTIVDAISKALEPVIKSVTAALVEHKDQFMAVLHVIEDVVAIVETLGRGLLSFIGTVIRDVAPFLGAVLGAGFKAVGYIISDVINFIGDLISVFQVLEKVGKAVASAIASAFGLVASEIKSALNGVISLINKVIDGLDSIHISIPSWVPGLGGRSFGIDIPHIPMLAEGGIVTKPTLAMIGEAGAEAVIPLSKGGMGGINVVVNVQGSVVQEQDLAISVRDQIAILMRRRGLNPSILGV